MRKAKKLVRNCKKAASFNDEAVLQRFIQVSKIAEEFQKYPLEIVKYSSNIFFILNGVAAITLFNKDAKLFSIPILIFTMNIILYVLANIFLYITCFNYAKSNKNFSFEHNICYKNIICKYYRVYMRNIRVLLMLLIVYYISFVIGISYSVEVYSLLLNK